MSDRTISRSSPSTSPTSRTAARSRRAGPGRLAAVGVALLAAPHPANPPAVAAEPCAPLAATSTLAAPQEGDLYLRAGAAACDRIAIEVVGRGLEGAFTLAFDVRYPAGLLTYDGHAAGALLEQGSPRTQPLYLVRAAGPGAIAVTLTRFAPDPGAGATGDAVILTLKFRRAGAGTGAIDFDPAPSSPAAEQVLGADGAARPARFGPGHGATLTVP